MSKKTRSDSKLDALPQNQRECLVKWLFVENLSYAEAAKRLREDFAVSIAPSSLGEFYQRVSQERLMEKIASSVRLSNDVQRTFKENAADFYASLVNMAGKIAFDKVMDSEKELDAETVFNFTKLVMTARKQAMEAESLDLDKRKLKLLEQKAAAFDQAKEVASEKLTPEEKERKIKAIFGLT